jgi:hypothetical protein
MKYGNNMKYLDRFENHYLKLSEIILTLEDILLELKDEGIEWVLTPNNDIRKKILSMYLRDIVSRSGHTEFSLKFYVNSKLTDRVKRSGFLSLPDWFIDVLARIEDYINSIGLKVFYSVRIPGEWVNMDSLKDLSECGYLVSEIKLEFDKN